MIFQYPPILLLLAALVSVFAVHYFIEKRRKHWMLIDPLNCFIAGALAIYVIQPFFNFESLVFNYSPSLFAKTLLWIVWGMIWVIIGYHSRLGVKFAKILPNMPACLRPAVVTQAGFAMVVLGLLGYAYLIASAGGVAAWLAVGRGATDWSSLSGYVANLEYFIPVGVTLLVFSIELFPTSLFFRLFIWSLAALQWLWFVYLGTRSRTIFFLFALVAAHYLPRRKNPSWFLLGFVAIPLWLITSFQANYRGQFTDLSFHLDTTSFSEVKSRILPKALGGTAGEAEGISLGDLEFNCVMAVVENVPTNVPYNYGYTLLEIPTRAVPRAVWPNKIYPLMEAGSPIMEIRDLSRHWIDTPNSTFLGGPAFSYVGYWYQMGGGLALLIGGLYTGAFFRAIRGYVDRDPASQGNLVFYVILLPIGFQEAVTTPFLWIFFTAPSIVVTFLFLRWARDRQDESAPAPQLA